MASPHHVGSHGKNSRYALPKCKYMFRRASKGLLTIGGATTQQAAGLPQEAKTSSSPPIIIALLPTHHPSIYSIPHYKHQHQLTSIFLSASMTLIYILVLINISRKSTLKRFGRLAVERALQGMHDVERSNNRVNCSTKLSDDLTAEV